MLERQTALVTGSTSGIGLGIALSLARQGANIILNGFGDAEAPRPRWRRWASRWATTAPT
jgi:3-hydroxybutyrate dehydrogenase